MIRATGQSRRKATTVPEAVPMAIRFAGTGADLTADRAAAPIDPDFGDPAKKVVAGSTPIGEEARAMRIMAAVVATVDVPLTVKTRTDRDEVERNAPRLARMARNRGVAMVSAHRRIRCQLRAGQADRRFIAAVKDAVTIAVVASGDVGSLDDARRCPELSRADGVMRGGSRRGRPRFAGQVAAHLETGMAPADPSRSARRAIVHEPFAAVRVAAVRALRTYRGRYAHGRSVAAAFRNAVDNTMDPAPLRPAV